MDVLGLRAGTTGEQAIETLRQVAVDAANLAGQSAGRGNMQILDLYLSWTVNAERLLGNILGPNTVTDLIHGPQYWALRTATEQTPRLTQLVLIETDRCQQLLSAAADQLCKERDRWHSHAATLVVPDTNMFLQQDTPFEQIDWHTAIRSRIDVRLVLPLVVVHELDRLKRQGNNTTSKMARHSLKWLAENLPTTPHGEPTKLSAGYPQTTIEVYVQDGPARPEDADEFIITFARQLASISGRRTKLVTRDLGMRIRATALGVEAIQLPDP